MKALRKYSRAGLVLSMIAGGALAILLCAQCVGTYLYVGRTLVPRAAAREAERQGGVLSSAARTAAITDPQALSPVMEHDIEEASERVVWMRLLNQESAVLAQAGAPQGKAVVPPRWWERAEAHDTPGRLVDTPRGRALVSMVPFRMPRPPGVGGPPGAGRTDAPGRPEATGRPPSAGERPRSGGRPAALALEVAIQLDAVAGNFSGLRQNLVVGMLASLALLAAMIVIGIRTPNYLRGKYLEKEMALARRVQNDLLPKAVSVSPYVDFAAAALAADQVGGDFLDVFETDAGRVSLVLGDASGKGISSALLASVIQGAIRSSSGSHHETACERINRMLCEKTASERFVTLFWGIFDPLTATLRYVNAGHAAPLLLRADPARQGAPERLTDGGPVLGILPHARYNCGIVQVASGDTLIVYSDGINEAADLKQEEFGDDRIWKIASEGGARPPREICDRIMSQVAGFAAPGSPQDDRTLMVVRFLKSRAAMTA
jgi:serine phosphatase RsbU (regulator of sigma subunit)